MVSEGADTSESLCYKLSLIVLLSACLQNDELQKVFGWGRDRQTDRQIEKETDRQTDRERERDR